MSVVRPRRQGTVILIHLNNILYVNNILTASGIAYFNNIFSRRSIALLHCIIQVVLGLNVILVKH